MNTIHPENISYFPNLGISILDTSYSLEELVSQSLLTTSQLYLDTLKEIKDVLNQEIPEPEKQAQLHAIAHHRLGSPPFHSYESKHQLLLSILFYFNTPEHPQDAFLTAKDVASVILRSLEESIERISRECPSSADSNPVEIRSWYDRMRDHIQSPEEAIAITHGGGYWYLTRFLQGREFGYANELNRRGIFVTPHIPFLERRGKTNRDLLYAIRTPLEHFDLPAVFEAKIPANHLVNVQNEYEAVVFSEAVEHLTDIKLRRIAIDAFAKNALIDRWVGKGSQFNDFTEIYQAIYDKYPPELMKRFEAHLQKFIPEAMLIPST